MPLPAPLAAGVRGPFENRVVVDAANSFPCRRCLRDAEVGEEVAAVAYLHVHNAAPGCFAVRIDRG